MKNLLLNMMSDSFFPPICFGCDAFGAELCSHCLEKMSPSDDRCVFCGKLYTSQNGCVCTSKKHLESVVSLWKYEQPVSQLIKNCKYFDKPKAAVLLLQFLRVRQLARLLRLIESSLNPLLVPVPLHKDRLQERGFDQARLIAETLGIVLRVPVIKKGTIIRLSKTTPQAKIKTKEERMKNVLGVFYVVKPKELIDKTTILVDDVLTTGATLASLAHTVNPYTKINSQGIVLAHET